MNKGSVPPMTEVRAAEIMYLLAGNYLKKEGPVTQEQKVRLINDLREGCKQIGVSMRELIMFAEHLQGISKQA